MTTTKMIKTLSSYEDSALFEFIDEDKFDFEKDEFTYPVRDVILLSDIISEFTEKSGYFYNRYKATSDFRELIKLIESGKSGGKIKKHYEDSAEERKSQWKQYHADETEWQWEQRKKEERRKNMMGLAEWDAITQQYLGDFYPYYLQNYRQHI